MVQLLFRFHVQSLSVGKYYSILLECILVWHNFYQKLLENLKMESEGGTRVPRAPRFATASC